MEKIVTVDTVLNHMKREGRARPYRDLFNAVRLGQAGDLPDFETRWKPIVRKLVPDMIPHEALASVTLSSLMSEALDRLRPDYITSRPAYADYLGVAISGLKAMQRDKPIFPETSLKIIITHFGGKEGSPLDQLHAFFEKAQDLKSRVALPMLQETEPRATPDSDAALARRLGLMYVTSREAQTEKGQARIVANQRRLAEYKAAFSRDPKFKTGGNDILGDGEKRGRGR